MDADATTASATSRAPGSLSIVVPAWNEVGNVERLHALLDEALASIGMPWEVIFVDDGSTDGTWDVVRALHDRDTRVRGVRLSRNFGHQCALLAGLGQAGGDAVVSMDADLQHPPEIVPALVEAWRRGSRIVHTVRIDAHGPGLLKRLSSRAFYAVFAWLGGLELRHGMADFRLLDRQVLDDILSFRENPLFLRGVVQWVGYPSSTVTFRGGTRFSGSTKYTLQRMLKFAWHGVSSFSLVPLRIGIIIGLGASLLAFLGVAYAIYGKLVTGSAIPGWASTVAILSFLFGVLFVYLGLLGEYVGRIVVEVRRRPRFLVSELIGHDRPRRPA